MANKKRNAPATPATFQRLSAPNPHFKGIAIASDNFVAVQGKLRSPVLGYQLDLTNARSIAAGTAVLIMVSGNAFYVDANTDVGNATVHFQDTNLQIQQPGIFIGPQFIARVPFTQILVENAAQVGKTLRFFYGVDIDFVPGLNNQVVISNAILLDPASARYYYFGDFESQTLQAFEAGAAIGPIAAQASFIQLFNPGGSGKLLYVDEAECGPLTATDRVQLFSHNAAIGALVTQGINRNLGGAAGVGALRSGTTGALPGTVMRQGVQLVNSIYNHPVKAPYVLNPGFGLHFASFTVNTALLGNFAWREKAT